MTPRIAILGPFETATLRPHLYPSDALDRMSPGMGGSSLVNLVMARLEKKLPTDVITLDPAARDPVTRYDGELARLWVVRRRPRKAMRDQYQEETGNLIQALKESRADICHANWTYEYGLAAIRQSDVPALVTVHDHAGKMLRYIGLPYLPHYVMARKVMKQCAHLTAVSPHIADYIRAVCAKTACMIPNILSGLVWETKEVANHNHPSIISALTWARYRNPKTALKAFAIFRKKNPSATYTMIGPGFEPHGPAHQWALRRKLDQGVIFGGRVPYRNALKLIARSSVLLHPSLEESFGGPVAEAMALGVPVIASREAGGPSWLLGDGFGRRVNGHSVGEMAGALDAAVHQSGTFQTEAARKHIRTVCDPDVVLGRWTQLYEQIMKGTA